MEERSRQVRFIFRLNGMGWNSISENVNNLENRRMTKRVLKLKMTLSKR